MRIGYSIKPACDPVSLFIDAKVLEIRVAEMCTPREPLATTPGVGESEDVGRIEDVGCFKLGLPTRAEEAEGEVVDNSARFVATTNLGLEAGRCSKPDGHVACRFRIQFSDRLDVLVCRALVFAFYHFGIMVAVASSYVDQVVTENVGPDHVANLSRKI